MVLLLLLCFHQSSNLLQLDQKNIPIVVEISIEKLLQDNADRWKLQALLENISSISFVSILCKRIR